MIVNSQRYKILECYSTHNWRICFIEINIESLHEPLCYKPRFMSHNLIVLIPFLDENPFESHREDSTRCRYCMSEYLSLGEQGQFRLNCIFPLILVRALSALCHGLRIWIILDDFCNYFSEINIDNCRLSII